MQGPQNAQIFDNLKLYLLILTSKIRFLNLFPCINFSILPVSTCLTLGNAFLIPQRATRIEMELSSLAAILVELLVEVLVDWALNIHRIF